MAFNYTLLTNYILCFLLGVLPIIILQKKYIISWMKVKLPMFKADVQVRVKNPIDDYFTTGVYANGVLTYAPKPSKHNKKPLRMLTITQEHFNKAVYRANGIPCIDTDDVKNCVLIWNGAAYDAVEGFNVDVIDKITEVIASEPDPNANGMNNKTFQLIMIGGMIITCVAIFFLFKSVGKIDGNVRLIGDMVFQIHQASNLTAQPLTL